MAKPIRFSLIVVVWLAGLLLLTPKSALAATCNWTGNVDSTWATIGNWDCGQVPVSGDIAVIGPAINSPLVSTSTTVGTIIINSGGILTYSAGSGVSFSITTFTINDGGKFIHNRATTVPITGSNRTFSSGSTVEIQDWATTTSSALPTFGNVIINSASTIQFAGYLSVVNGTLTKQNTGELRLGTTHAVSVTIGGNFDLQGGTGTIQSGNTSNTATMSLNGNVSIASGATLQRGSSASGLWSLDVKGNWINNGGTFTAGTSTVGFNGTSAQTISGTTTFNNLTINNGTGGSTTLAADATVNGTLTLTTDLQTASSNNLTLGSSATCSGNGDVLGNVKRTSISAGSTYCFGNPNVSINFASGTFASPSIVMSLVKPKPANADFSNAVNRLYSINANGVDSFTATLRLHYLDAELNGNTEGATLALWKFVGSNTWTKFDNTNNNTTNNWVEHNAITGFSSWVLSNNAPASPTPITIASMEVESGGPDLTHATVAIGALGILAFGAIIFARN